MYQWITKYQWITILCLLLFFIVISIKNKECFSVGGQGNGGNESNINISSNLYLDSSMCCDNNLKCDDNSDCSNDNCFYDPNKIKIEDNKIVYNCSGNCKNGNKTRGQLCISDTKDTIDNIMDHANNVESEEKFLDFVKTNLSNSDTILCSKGNVCNKLPTNLQDWETEYDKINHSDDKVKSICSNYQKLSNPSEGNPITIENCYELNIGTCK
jgi:hypothetical protein